MNKVILLGRLTRDPETRYNQLASGSMAISKFSIAVDRRFQKKEGETTADFFSCTAFGKLGEFVQKYLAKGAKIVLTGRIQNDNYTNKSGEKVYSVQIIVDEIEFAGAKTESNNQAPQPAPDGAWMDIPEGIDTDLPFK